MLVVYVSVWPFIVFGWKESRRAETVTDGWKARQSRLRETARAMVCRKLNARRRKDCGYTWIGTAEVDGAIENVGHVHTVTKRLELSELGEGVKCCLGEVNAVRAPYHDFKPGADMDFGLDEGKLSHRDTLLRSRGHSLGWFPTPTAILRSRPQLDREAR